MQKTIKLAAAVILFVFGATSCGGGGAMNNASPKEVLTAFFEKLSKKDIAGASALATKDSEPVLNMMKTALEMAEKFKDMSDKEKDMAEEFKNVEYGETKIDGDNAVVPIKAKNEDFHFDFPLKKENGGWKVDFSLATMSKMDRKGGKTADGDAQEMDQKLDPEALQKAYKSIDSAMKTLTPEQLKAYKETVEGMKEKMKDN